MRMSIIAGISGEAGKVLMETMLNNRHFRKIIVLTRRENKRIKNIHLKKVIVDFSDMEGQAQEFEGVDDVFCLLGTEFISTHQLDDANKFDYEYPMKLAVTAKKMGVRNFVLLNSVKATADAKSEKHRLRYKLASEIEAMGFDNFFHFQVNGVSSPVNVRSSLFAAKKGIGSIVNIFSFNLLSQIKKTPANILVGKMLEAVVSTQNDKRVFLPKDY